MKICWSHKEAQISISMHFIFSFFLLFLLSLYYCFTQIKYYTKQSKAKQKCMCVFSSDTLGHENCDLCTYSQKNFSPSKSQSHAQSQSQSPLKSQNPPLCSPTSPFDSCSFRSCFFFVRYSTVVPISIIIFARNIKKNKRKTKRERHKSSDIEIEKANRITLQNFRKNFKSHWIRHFWQMILHLTDGYAPCMNAWILDFHSIVSFDFFFNCIRLFRWLIFVLSHHIAMKTFVLLFCI